MNILTIAYHSGFGHTKKVAEHVVKGAASFPNTKAVLLDVTKVDEAI